MIPLDHVIPDGDLRPDQPDVPDEVLSARVVAAGEMNVYRSVQLDTRFQVIGGLQRVRLGVGRGELASCIAGACDQPAADASGGGLEPQDLDLALNLVHLVHRDVG